MFLDEKYFSNEHDDLLPPPEYSLCLQHPPEDSKYLIQHDFIRSSRSQDRKIRIEIKDFIDRARRRRGLSDTDEDFGEGDEFDLAAMIQEEERGDTLVDEAPGATLRRNLTMMQGGDPSPVGMQHIENRKLKFCCYKELLFQFIKEIISV